MTTSIDLAELAAKRKTRYTGWRLKLNRTLQLGRRFSARQVALRLRNRVRQKLGWTRIPPLQAGIASRDHQNFIRLFDATVQHDDSASWDSITAGKITLLNQSVETGFPVDWQFENHSRPSHLWRFQLHYHEFLLEAARNRSDQDQSDIADSTLGVLKHWIDSNRPQTKETQDAAWHPYCISRRLPVWFKLIAVFRTHWLNAALEELNQSALQQTQFLAQHLETDLGGNHLLENLHALGMASCYFDDQHSGEWSELVVSCLEHELDRQLLESGEHFELSPMYHCVVAGNLLQLAIASAGVHERLYQLCVYRAERMIQFLEQILMPDGEIPLLGDSCFGEGPSVTQLKAWWRRLQPAVCVAGGSHLEATANHHGSSQVVGHYWLNRRGDDVLLFDAGPTAPRNLPAHGHCDLLNLVGAINGERLLVDSGNGSYDVDPDRVYSRSSVAHNVLTVNELDHCDVWSKFRMGYSGTPSGFQTGEDDHVCWARCFHDAYASIGAGLVQRWVGSAKDSSLWVCLDSIQPTSSRELRLEGFVHFAPTVTVEDPDRLVVDHSGVPIHIQLVGIDDWQWVKSWYYPEFGRRREKWALYYTASTMISTVIGWVLRPYQPINVGFRGIENCLSIGDAGADTTFQVENVFSQTLN